MKDNNLTDFLDIISSASRKSATPEDIQKKLRDSKDVTKTGVHNFILRVMSVSFALIVFGVCLCFCAYFCYIIRGVDVPDGLDKFITKSVEWVLVAGASFFASLKIKSMTE